MNHADFNTMIAVPTRGSVRHETVVRLNELREGHDDLPPIKYVQGALSVAQTRNKIVAAFMESSKQFLLMVDDDVVPPWNVLSLFDQPVEMGVVALPYVMWTPEAGPHLSVYNDIGEGIQPRGLENGLNMVDVAGTGCMAFSRHVFERMHFPHPFRFSRLPSEAAFSEDILFCRDVRSVGMDVMAWWDGSYADHAKLIGLGELFEKRAA